jgi:hypothetical protein
MALRAHTVRVPLWAARKAFALSGEADVEIARAVVYHDTPATVDRLFCKGKGRYEQYMLRSEINDIRVRWNPKERRGSNYDPVFFVETPEQARRLLEHLHSELDRAKREKNTELIHELTDSVNKVESLSRKFFRWEKRTEYALEDSERKEIEKLPMGL